MSSCNSNFTNISNNLYPRLSLSKGSNWFPNTARAVLELHVSNCAQIKQTFLSSRRWRPLCELVSNISLSRLFHLAVVLCHWRCLLTKLYNYGTFYPPRYSMLKYRWWTCFKIGTYQYIYRLWEDTSCRRHFANLDRWADNAGNKSRI